MTLRPVDPPALAASALGLAVGTTNLVAARSGQPPVTRRSVLTLWANRPAEVGVPSQNSELTSPNLTEAGIVMRGFVERVGDPVPLVAADGSAYRGEALLVAALEAMARSGDDGRPVTAVLAVPAHWGAGAIGALRGALRDSAVLSPGGAAPMIVPDSAAALAALQASPGLPGSGVVALCDFGGSGSSITLADAGAGMAPIGQTIRFGDFSGDQIDQAVLNHVLTAIRAAGHNDPAGTAAVGALSRLRQECRLAKERLSTETATVVPAELPGHRSDVRLTRSELDDLIAALFAGFLDALGDALESNRIPAASLAAVATVGGGAAIPAISQRLSEALRVPVITRPDPAATAAQGAAVLAARGNAAETATAIAPVAADVPTSLAPTAWAVGTAGQAATESASDGSPSATYRALAWSQSEDAAEEPVPYVGEDYHVGTPPSGSGPVVEFDRGPVEFEDDAAVPAGPLPWYRRPPLLFGIAAALAALAVGGLAVTLTGVDSTPTTTTTRVTKPGESPSSPAPPPVPVTTTVTGSNGSTTVTTVTPTTTAAPTSSTAATTTTTTTPTTTTTTTTATTTTTTTTTPTTTTTTPPPTTTNPPTTTAPPTTTVEPTTETVPPRPTTQEEVVPTRPTPVEEVPPTRPAPVEEPAATQE